MSNYYASPKPSKPDLPNAFVAAATATQPQRYVIADAESLETLHPDGAWIASTRSERIKQ